MKQCSNEYDINKLAKHIVNDKMLIPFSYRDVTTLTSETSCMTFEEMAVLRVNGKEMNTEKKACN